MAATSFKFELNHRPKADGTCAILLRITHNRKLRRIGLGYSVLPEDWKAGSAALAPLICPNQHGNANKIK